MLNKIFWGQMLIFTFMISMTASLDYSADFFLSDADLYQKARFGGGVGNCRITGGCSTCACSMYGKTLSLGLPDKYGSGCLDGCWGTPNTYYNYVNTVLPICTANQITNAANMIRIGIVKSFCSNNSISVFANDFFLSDAALLQKAQNGGVGTCRITVGCSTCACSMYGKTTYGGQPIGLPDRYGSGCLDGCWGPPNFYLNYVNTVLPICTSNQTTNAANMIRIAIVKGYCEDTGSYVSVGSIFGYKIRP